MNIMATFFDKIMVVYFLSLDSISGNTPLQTSSDSVSELDEFSSPPLYFSLVQLSLSMSLSVSTGSSSDYKNRE